MSHTSVLGLYRPGDGWLFRLGVGTKYLLVLLVTLPPLVLVTWWVTLAAIAVVIAALVTSGIGLARVLRLGTAMWVVVAVLVGYHLITLHPLAAVVRPGNLLVAVLAARMLTLTTPTPELMDAIARVLRPLRPLGVDPDQIALAVALMVRSIPYLLGSVSDARAAAWARGIDRNPTLLLVPLLMGAVAYADRTAEALAARGIGQSVQSDGPASAQ
ncbi:MAG: energy-coupling factor transporter transmembrane component T family protein [Arachnia sp.]